MAVTTGTSRRDPVFPPIIPPTLCDKQAVDLDGWAVVWLVACGYFCGSQADSFSIAKWVDFGVHSAPSRAPPGSWPVAIRVQKRSRLAQPSGSPAAVAEGRLV